MARPLPDLTPPASDVPAADTRSRELAWAWRGALAVFVAAGLTGALFRAAVALGWAGGLDLGNVRHAHSHLMYFGWGTPALMALVARALPAVGGRPIRSAAWIVGTAFALALLAYPPFLLWGYSPAVLGGRRLPLSVITAGLNVLAWYWFAAAYLRAREGAHGPAVAWWDVAVFALLLATLGAWGLALMKPLGVENEALQVALTHVFLDVFSEGWFGLGVLGLAALATARADEPPGARWGRRMVAAGVPFTFALAMPAPLVPPAFALLASVGGGLVAAGTLLAVAALWRDVRGAGWRVALACLALKAVAEGVASATPGAGWAGLPGLRILYVHLLLLGFVTLGLVAAARGAWGAGATRGHAALAAAVVALLLSLLPLTAAWPAAWSGWWAYALAGALALGPPLAAAWMAARGGDGGGVRA